MTDHLQPDPAGTARAGRRAPALRLGFVVLSLVAAAGTAAGAARAAPPPTAPPTAAMPAPARAAMQAQAPVQVRAPWFRYLLASLPAGGYLTLENVGAAPAVLTGATSPACGSLMLHRTESGGGTDRMVGVTQVTIPAHGQFRFAPDGYHLMCMDPRMRPGQTVPVTLRFADGRRTTVRFVVRGANGAPPPSRAMPPRPMTRMHM